VATAARNKPDFDFFVTHPPRFGHLFQKQNQLQMNKINALILSGCAAWTFSAAAADIDWSKLPPASTKTGLNFTNDILPMFKDSCVRCHGANRPRAQLRLDKLDGVLKGTEKGQILTAGDGANSLLVKAVSQLDSETTMPPKPRGRRGPGGGSGGPPPGAGGPAMQPGGEAGPAGPGGGNGGPGPGAGGLPGTNGPGMRPRNFGPPAKPLTAEQVGLIRAWIDQGAK
jgi:hypothetical protein